MSESKNEPPKTEKSGSEQTPVEKPKGPSPTASSLTHINRQSAGAQSGQTSKKGNGGMVFVAILVGIAAIGLTYYFYKKRQDPNWQPFGKKGDIEK